MSTPLSNNAVDANALESSVLKLWQEFLARYFDGGAHDVGAVAAVAFPKAELHFQQSAVSQPLGQRTEVGGQRTEDGGQRSAAGGQRTEVGGQRTEVGGQRTEVGGRRTEVGGQRSGGLAITMVWSEGGGRKWTGWENVASPVPSGGSPDGTGGSPVLPRTRQEICYERVAWNFWIRANGTNGRALGRSGSQRRHATGSVDASGTLAGQASLSLANRRAALLALQRKLKAEVNCADGTLTYGDWSQCVRVEDFQAEINQAETGIEWSLSATYSLFPNEGGYATAEYTVNDREDVESGDESFAFNGKISAPTQALATAKLNSLRTAVLAMYGWSVPDGPSGIRPQQVRSEVSSQSVYANGDITTFASPPGGGTGPTGADDGGARPSDAADGTTFIELSFSEDYRRRIQGLLVGCTLSVSNREDIPAQTLLTTYSGTVMATGPTSDAAYGTALARAQALGANREAAIDSTAYLRSSMIGFDHRQLTQNSVTELLRVTFSYEYQSKVLAGRAYIEMTASVNRDTFGVDVETCSGLSRLAS